MMAPVTERPVETGSLPDTPVEDTLLRRFVHNQADVNAVIAGALGGRGDRTDDVFLADAASPVPYFNQAILARPLAGPDDPVLDIVDPNRPVRSRATTQLTPSKHGRRRSRGRASSRRRLVAHALAHRPSLAM